MKWLSPLFIHWPIEVTSLRPHLPSALEIDTFEGQAWLTVLPFRMAGVRLRYTPGLPGLSTFLELNVRTYVKAGGKGGIWALSVDAARAVVVRAAQVFFDLPFYYAKMSCTAAADGHRFSSQRLSRGVPPAAFVATYRPVGPVKSIGPGTLDHWLTERYCIYASDRKGRILRAEVQHSQWPLQPVEVEIQTNTLLDALGLTVAQTAPRCHYSSGVEVVAWKPEVL